MSDNFLEYFDDSASLEDRVSQVFGELHIKEKDRKDIKSFMMPLKIKHLQSYEHSLRVGLLCGRIAREMHLSQKALFFPGLLHDVGKAMVLLSTLAKISGWTAEDTKNMHGHVMAGYQLLRDRFSFSAEVMIWHHKFQTGAYPKVHTRPAISFSAGTKMMIPFYGRMLALADFYDALHRINDHFGHDKNMTGDEIKNQMMEKNPDQRELIEELYLAGVFTTHINRIV